MEAETAIAKDAPVPPIEQARLPQKGNGERRMNIASEEQGFSRLWCPDLSGSSSPKNHSDWHQHCFINTTSARLKSRTAIKTKPRKQ
jgi:hypothetical protein